jgi:hypothetical protein
MKHRQTTNPPLLGYTPFAGYAERHAARVTRMIVIVGESPAPGRLYR